MFAPGFVTLFFVALFAAGHVAGYPVPEPLRVRCPFTLRCCMDTLTALLARVSSARSGAV